MNNVCNNGARVAIFNYSAKVFKRARESNKVMTLTNPMAARTHTYILHNIITSREESLISLWRRRRRARDFSCLISPTHTQSVCVKYARRRKSPERNAECINMTGRASPWEQRSPRINIHARLCIALFDSRPAHAPTNNFFINS